MSSVWNNIRPIVLIFITALPFLFSLKATAQKYEWAKSAGGPTRSAYIQPQEIQVDAAGNSYVTGIFHSQITFGDITLHSSDAGIDFYIAKYNAEGKLLWVKREGGSGSEVVQNIEVDATGNIYVSGHFVKSPQRPICEIGKVLLRAGDNETEYFLAKYSTDGEFKWVRQTYNTGQYSDLASTLDIDKDGNVILQGSFWGKVNFGVTSLEHEAGRFSLFVAKYNPAGEVMWATSQVKVKDYLNTRDNIWAAELETDDEGNIYYAGNFKGTLDLSNGLVNSREEDNFILKLNAAGEQVWARTFGNEGFDHINDLEIDSKGNPYVLLWAGKPVIDEVSNPLEWGNFVAKFDQNGKAYQINTLINGGTCYAMTLDKQDNVYIIGYHGSEMTLDCVTLPAASNSTIDIFFLKQGANGTLQWVKDLEGLYQIFPIDIALDASNNVYGTGYFSGNLTFDNINVLNIGGINQEENGLFTDDMFITKITNTGVYAPPPTISITCAIPERTTNKNVILKASATSINTPITYKWDLGNGDILTTTKTTLNYTYATAGNYTVTVKAYDNRGCNETCTGILEILEPTSDITIPNIFTPNGDGKNDVFKVVNYTLDKPVLMHIYNRWGKQVTIIENGINGWDGYGCPEGIYYYHINAAGVDRKGWVELVR
ncbi:gliding motility-associated C-terminal domain-containing protein [Pontibacter sp. H259]|uniref:T9SS type B sorting domain-containing protein n=1 Tax=Pontibacter sp. H259 TaxID=3133421 RepID=UPI0030BE779F